MTIDELIQRAEQLNKEFPINPQPIPNFDKPDDWMPIFKPMWKSGYPTSPKIGLSRTQLNLIYLRLQDKWCGLNPDKVKFCLDNRRDKKKVWKSPAEFNKGDACDLILALKKKKVFTEPRIKVREIDK